jgi:Family of unknown function (DUF6148)
MAGITLLQAQTQLNSYLAAETVLTGQRYEIAGRMLQRANLLEIQAGVKLWNSRVITLTNQSQGRSRSRTVVVGF